MMQHRTLSRRLAAWLMLGLLALIVGEPLRVHACPMHDGAAMTLLGGAAAHTPDAGAARGHAMSDGTQHPDGGGHGGQHVGHGQGSQGGDSHGQDGQRQGDHSHHACQCVGACCTAAPVAAPSQVTATVGLTLVTTAVVAPAVPVAVPGSGDVVLPFAIGPPASA